MTGKLSLKQREENPGSGYMPLLVVPLLGLAGIHLVERSLPYFLACAGTTIRLACLSWEVFERPINDLKRRFEYAPKHPQLKFTTPTQTAASQPGSRCNF